MKTWAGYAAVLSALALLPVESFAQGTDFGITGGALVSIQPRDDTYIGGPYLNEGLGGVGPGLSGGVSVITPVGFAVVGEFTTARFELEQVGRLVAGCTGPEPCIGYSTRWRASMLSGLIGYGKSVGRSRVLLLGGVSKSLGVPTVGSSPRPVREPNDGATLGRVTGFPLALTGGLDVLRTLGGRGTLVISGRYSFVERKNLIYLGMGPHVLRIGVGLRVRLN